MPNKHGTPVNRLFDMRTALTHRGRDWGSLDLDAQRNRVVLVDVPDGYVGGRRVVGPVMDEEEQVGAQAGAVVGRGPRDPDSQNRILFVETFNRGFAPEHGRVTGCYGKVCVGPAKPQVNGHVEGLARPERAGKGVGVVLGVRSGAIVMAPFAVNG